MKPISARERQRRQRQSEADKAARHRRLLYDRNDLIELFGISLRTIIRMEERGLLKPLKLSGCVNGKTFYGSDNVLALASGEQQVEDVA